MKGVEEGSSQLIVSCGDRPIDLQMSDHALDVIACAIDAPVPTDFGLPVTLWRDAASDARILQRRPDGVGVVALVGQQIGGFFFGKRHHVFERRAVRGFAGREVKGERDASGITETMNFTGEPAPRAAKSLFASPPFAPAAET